MKNGSRRWPAPRPARRAGARYEEHVKRLDNRAGFIDLFWPGTLIVEQKSAGRDLTAAADQAGTYFDALPDRDRPRYQLVCDFQTFELLDRDERVTTRFALADLPDHVERFGLIMGLQQRTFRDQDPVNIAAAELMGRLHDRLKEGGYTGHDLERFLVSLMFCLFADDTGIFGENDMLRDYLESRTAPDGTDLGPKLNRLFHVLDTPEDRRQHALDPDLARFPLYRRGAVCRILPAARFRRADARRPAGSGRVRLDGDFARDLRLAVPVGDEPGRKAGQGRALHHRKEHPEGDRTAVSGRSARRACASESAEDRPPPAAGGVPEKAAVADLFRPRLRLRKFPDRRLSRIASAGDGGAARTQPQDGQLELDAEASCRWSTSISSTASRSRSSPPASPKPRCG
jgi:hypothetical protein